jgi:hypothetical protein
VCLRAAIHRMGELVRFRLGGKAAGLWVGPSVGAPATFERGDITVTIESEVDESWQGEEPETGDIRVTVETTREISREIAELFESAIMMEEALLSSDGDDPPAALLAWLNPPPDALFRLCEDVRSELYAEAGRLVRLLRWLFNRVQPADPLGTARMRWSFDGRRWYGAPSPVVERRTLGSAGLELNEDALRVVDHLWTTSVAEPLSRQLLLEAVALRWKNPGAAWILAVAAAEVGVKEFASRDRPSEAWLLQEIQSPPLDRILWDYLMRRTGTTEKKTNAGRAVPGSHEKSSPEGRYQAKPHHSQGGRGAAPGRGTLGRFGHGQRPSLPT